MHKSLADLGEAVLWFDNFYKCNFRPVPGNENRSLNCIAGAIILLKRPVDIMPSFPSLSVLRQRIGYTTDLLSQSPKNFIDDLQGLMDDPIRLQHVRCPLDIRRANVTSPAWTPFFRTHLTVSATPDVSRLFTRSMRCSCTHSTVFHCWSTKIFITASLSSFTASAMLGTMCPCSLYVPR